jgi:hypothetical protein
MPGREAPSAHDDAGASLLYLRQSFTFVRQEKLILQYSDVWLPMRFVCPTATLADPGKEFG